MSEGLARGAFWRSTSSVRDGIEISPSAIQMKEMVRRVHQAEAAVLENSHNTWSNREIDEPHEDEVVSTGIREVLKEEGSTFLSPEFIRRALCPESAEGLEVPMS
jgi:hypothetical protein